MSAFGFVLSKVFLLFVLLLLKSVASQTVVKTLPGFNGTLPFKLETGYVSVGDENEVKLFYYFIESENNPDKDPLLLWLTGGPGCSGFSGLVYEIGPLTFDYSSFDGSLPSFLLNPYSWTKIANIIFLDSPVGTGFSYATTAEGYEASDTKSAKDIYTFLKKWLLNHPTFIKNRLFIAGDSYSGKNVPMVALQVSKGNEAGSEPHMYLEGYLIGNPAMNVDKDKNERIPYANRMGLISDEYFELAKSSCHGEYVNPDPDNAWCHYALEVINKCIENINQGQILEPKCKFMSPKSDGLKWDQDSLENNVLNHLASSVPGQPLCRNHNYITSYIWANDPTVQEALNITEGTKPIWQRCNESLYFELGGTSYKQDVTSVFRYHQILIEKVYGVLVYSGDHDMIFPNTGTRKWIRALNLTVKEDWRPWNLNGQVAGYTEKYTYKDYVLTFATIKGAGHTAPEYKPAECFSMVQRWLSSSSL